jgi:NADPH2:quinone reductase
MTYAVRIEEFGGPEVLRWSAVEAGAPGPHEVLLRQTVVGVNYADVYMRSGNHPAVKGFPATLGMEAAGVVAALGREVHELAVGDRVAYFGLLGAYAETRIVPADHLIKLPSGVDDRVAAAIMVKGTTARYLCKEAYPIKEGDIAVVHAAVGGVGMILCQWAASMGATVIGTVGSEKKVDVALQNGCRHVIVTSSEDFVERVSKITEGRKADVVYDALGAETSVRSLDCLRPRGTLVCFGRTVGWPHAIEPSSLMLKGSLILMMTQVTDFMNTPAQKAHALADLFAAVSSGTVRANIGQQYSLVDAGQAHRDLQDRKTTGAIVLLV